MPLAMPRIEDSIQPLVDQWGAERPDLDSDSIAITARLLRLSQLLEELLGQRVAGYGLKKAEGDVLYVLRRSGKPYRLSPSRLSEALYVHSGTLTSRLDRLERKGMIERVRHPTDRRSVEVCLSEQGLKIVEEAATRAAEDLRRVIAPLSDRERSALNRATSKLIGRIGSGEWRNRSG